MTHPAARAFLALWNGISHPRLQPEYEAWHSFEHVPERVGLPGFLEARRYRAHADAPGQASRYFTCYWLRAADALDSASYREVVTAPTPWSARMRGELRDFLRLPCTLAGAHGVSSATQLATVHLRGTPVRLAAQLTPALAQLVAQAAVVCAHWGIAAAAPPFPIANRHTGDTDAAPPAPTDTPADAATDCVLMLQGLERAALRTHTEALLRTLAPHATALAPPAFFELLSQVRQDELQHPPDARQPARPDLFQSFLTPGDTP